MKPTGPRSDRALVRSLGALAVSVLLLGSCGEDGAQSTGSSLTSRAFLSTRVTDHDAEKHLAAGTRIRLQFGADARLTASVGCNTMGGGVSIVGSQFIVEDLSMTEMGCDPDLHDQDQWLAEFLGGDPRFALAGDRLTLHRSDASIELLDRRVADPDRPLEDTRWELDGIIEGEAVSSVPAGSSATLRISRGQLRVEVAGCATGEAHIDLRPGMIEMAPLAVTDGACGRADASVRDAISATLEGVVGYDIEAAVLTITHRDGDGLVFRGVD